MPTMRPRADLVRVLSRALDRPAREAHEIARRPLLFTVAPALLGVFLVAAASSIAGLVDPTRANGLPRFDVLRAALEALVVVVPAAIVFGTYLRLHITPAALLAASGLGLLVAGVVSISLVPLIAFLALVSAEVPVVLMGLSLLVPAVALATAAVVVHRVIETSDSSVQASFLSRAYSLGLFAVFAIRALPFVRQMIQAA